MQFPNGSANLTYLLTFTRRRRAAVRAAPSAVRRRSRPGAHDMAREFRVLSRLWRAYDRAPRAYLFCDDHDVVGSRLRRVGVPARRGGVGAAPAVDGRPPRRRAAHRAWRRSTPSPTCTSSTRRRATWPTSAGPTGYRRAPAARVARSAGRSSPRPSTTPMMTAVGERARAARCRTSPPPTLLHNDFKTDNCQFRPGRARSGDRGVRLGHGDARRPVRSTSARC